MLASLRKLGGARLYLLSEHGRAGALLAEAVATYGPAVGLALAESCMPGHWRSFARKSRGGSVGAVPKADEDFIELTLPDDLSAVAKLNPELRDVIEAHQEYARGSEHNTLRQRLVAALTEADPSFSPERMSVSKTALSRLRVDQLRQELEVENVDTRGTKDVLVGRLLGLLAERRQQAEEVLPAVEELGDGVVTRRQISQQEKRVTRKAQRVETYGISEAALREAQTAARVQKTEFVTVFQPEEVADMLLEARADNVCIIDVRNRCPFTDYMVIGTARSQRMAHMLASGVLHQLKARCKEVAPGVMPSIEGGRDNSEWQVVDAGSVVAHVFLEGYREEYDLEGLWGLPNRSNIRWLKPKATVHTLDTIRAA